MKNTIFAKYGFASCILISLSACGMSVSGPTDQEVKAVVQDWFDRKTFGYYAKEPFAEYIKLDSVPSIDRRVTDGKATVLAKIEVTCLKTWEGVMRSDWHEEVFGQGNGDCESGKKKSGEVTLHFEKFDSGWRAL